MPLTLIEEEFFRVGQTLNAPEPIDTFADLEGPRRPTFWQRLFGRKDR